MCGEVHPQREGVCDKPRPCTGYHADSCANVVWGYVAPPDPEPKRRRVSKSGTAKTSLVQMAQRAE